MKYKNTYHHCCLLSQHCWWFIQWTQYFRNTPWLTITIQTCWSYFMFDENINKKKLNFCTSKSIWSTMWMMEPPPSQGLIRYPLGSISALTKCCTGGMLGPFCVFLRDLSHIWNRKKFMEYSNVLMYLWIKRNLLSVFNYTHLIK
jgi:hypothetical protein